MDSERNPMIILGTPKYQRIPTEFLDIRSTNLPTCPWNAREPQNSIDFTTPHARPVNFRFKSANLTNFSKFPKSLSHGHNWTLWVSSCVTDPGL